MTTINTILTHNQPISNPHINHSGNNLILSKPLHSFRKNTVYIRKGRSSVVPRCLQKPSDHDNEEPLQKSSERWYASIGNENIRRFLEKVESGYPILHYVPATLILQSLIKNQGALVLSSLLAFAADHLDIVVKPTTKGGPDIGLRWQFEWRNVDIPLGPVCSLYTTHVYNGKIYLRNGSVFMNPLLHLEPLKKLQKMVAIAMLMLEGILRRERTGIFLSFSLSLLFMALSFILWKGKVV